MAERRTARTDTPARKKPAKILPISDGRGNMVENAGLYVLAAMHEPEGDPDALTLGLAVHREVIVEQLRSPEHAKRRINAKLALALLELPTMKDVEDPRFRDRWTRGCLAGELLLLVINCSAYSPNDASLRKAIELKHLDMIENGGNRTIGGAALNYGKSYLESCWAEFKSVAHLYALWRIQCDAIPESELEGLGPSLLGIAGNETTLQVVALAEAFRLRAERHRPPAADRFAKGRRVTLLRRGEAWRAPPDLSLPPVQIHIPPLTDWTIEKLSKYRARRPRRNAFS